MPLPTLSTIISNYPKFLEHFVGHTDALDILLAFSATAELIIWIDPIDKYCRLNQKRFLALAGLSALGVSDVLRVSKTVSDDIPQPKLLYSAISRCKLHLEAREKKLTQQYEKVAAEFTQDSRRGGPSEILHGRSSLC